MVPEKPTACTSERLAAKVHIHPKGPAVWKVTRVKSGVYTIVAQSRGASCLKFLGGAAKCSDEYTQLYAKDDGSGQQWWSITPVNPSSPSPKPKSPPSPKASPPTAVSPPLSVTSPPPPVSPQAAPPSPAISPPSPQP